MHIATKLSQSYLNLAALSVKHRTVVKAIRMLFRFTKTIVNNVLNLGVVTISRNIQMLFRAQEENSHHISSPYAAISTQEAQESMLHHTVEAREGRLNCWRRLWTVTLSLSQTLFAVSSLLPTNSCTLCGSLSLFLSFFS